MEELLKQMLGELRDFRTETNDKLEKLEAGQKEIKELLRHNCALTAENLTEIRQDSRSKFRDIHADVDLLFKEVETVKRHSNKMDYLFRVQP
jgi:Sec7-like guanine-nucleotide exchange factor